MTLVPETDQPSITSSIPALRDFKKGLLDRGVNFQWSYIQDTFGNPKRRGQAGRPAEACYTCSDATCKTNGRTG